MANVSFIGTLGCGKTTALGLLHEALTLYSLYNKNFRFKVDILSAGYLDGQVLVPLRSGEFPEKTQPGVREEVKFYLKFKKRVGGWNEVTVNSYDISGEEIEKSLENLRTARSIQQVVHDLGQRKVLKALLDSEVFIFIVDSMVCDPTGSKEVARKKAESDLFLRRLWEAISAYKKKTIRRNLRGLAVLFSKYDEAEAFLPLGPLDFYSIEDVHEPIEIDEEKLEDSGDFAEVMRKYLPSTYNSMRYGLTNIGHLKYFKSYINLREEGDAEGQRTPSIPLSFSLREFMQVANWLSRL